MQESSVAHSCPTLCNSINSSPPGFFVLGTLQARKLKWVATSYSRASSNSGIEYMFPESPALTGRFFTTELSGEGRGCKII